MCQLYLIKTEKKNRNLSFVVLVVINIRNVKKNVISFITCLDSKKELYLRGFCYL